MGYDWQREHKANVQYFSNMETDELAQHEEMGTALVKQYSIADVSSKVSFFKMEALEVGHLHDMATQTGLTSDMIEGIQIEMNRLMMENVSLRKDVEDSKFTQKYFEGNDKKNEDFYKTAQCHYACYSEFQSPHVPGCPRSI